ncbi:AAA family ATPase [Alkalicoccus halolimnae]|uniref:AAA family ATPase n=1 Tax=Alkalicoccus halolimnae TaxID=1667239 RepID=A0A5C7F914_9BACI|nr:AAA family ATPase [Alkalicoccus halolimnae]TXF86090.1 AAA family ATPase [Alkalicoccus halolimnae]
MEMQWLFYSDTNARADMLEECLEKRDYKLKRVTYLDRLFDHLKKDPNVVLLIKANKVYNVYQLCEELSAKYPHLHIVLMIPDNMENAKKAMKAGASNTIRFSADKDEIREMIVHAEKNIQHRMRQADVTGIPLIAIDQRVVSISSTKGGAGRSSVTVNLAAALAEQGQRVAVLDGDIQFGDTAMYLNLKPKKTIYEWVKEGDNRAELDIDQFMTKHDSGVSILAAPSRPEFFEMITAADIQYAIEELKNIYQVILIDNTAAISEVQLQCLKASDEILVLSNGELPCVRNTRLYFDTLESLQLSHKAKLVHNRSGKKGAIDPKKMEEVIGASIFASLSEQEAIVSGSIQEGVPYVTSHPRKPVAKDMKALAAKLMAGTEEKEQKAEKKKKKMMAKAQ